MEQYSKQELLERIEEYNRMYRIGTPVVSDAEYDALVERLREIDPKNKWFKSQEPAPVSDSRKVKLPVPMKSLEKVRTSSDIRAWVKSCGLKDDDRVVIMPKFDGLSMLVNERTKEAFTRGGSENEGQICTKHFQRLKDGFDCEWLGYTYGEFVITRNNWKSFFEGKKQENGNPYKSPRNTAAGLLNRDEASGEIEHCSFVRYGADIDSLMKCYFRYSSFLESIINNGADPDGLFDFVVRSVNGLLRLTDEQFVKLFSRWNSCYPIDGLVLYVDDLAKWSILGRKENGNPNYAIAYKHPDFTEAYETEVQKIEWQMSKSGYMKPVVIVDDVDNGDCIMNSPTGYNARYIKNNKIGAGAKILLTRSGGVIPKIISVVESAPIYEQDLPTSCPHCGEALCFNESGVELMCTNPECRGIRLAKCVFFYDIMKAENIGPSIIKAMFDAGLDSIDRMLHAQESELARIEGFGPGIIEAITTANRTILYDGVTLVQLMHASDCFPGLGDSKLAQMLSDFPEIAEAYYRGEYVAVGKDLDPKYTDTKTHQSFVNGLNAFSDFFMDTCIKVKPEEAVELEGDDMAGWAVCFSGVRDSGLEETIVRRGGKVVSGVSKNTTHLVVKDVNGSSSKIEKAKSLGIEIIDIEKFRNSIN